VYLLVIFATCLARSDVIVASDLCGKLSLSCSVCPVKFALLSVENYFTIRGYLVKIPEHVENTQLQQVMECVRNTKALLMSC